MNDLRLLLKEMAGLYDNEAIIGSETVSWKAYRTAETLDELEITPELFSILEESEDELIRKHGYEVLTFVLRNTQHAELGHKLISTLKAEDKRDEALYALLIGLLESEVTFAHGIENVIYYVDDERDLIRNAAIRLLAKFNADDGLAQKALREVIENHYDDYDLKYAKESLKALKSNT